MFSTVYLILLVYSFELISVTLREFYIVILHIRVLIFIERNADVERKVSKIIFCLTNLN
jgi:hypothetical protein